MKSKLSLWRVLKAGAYLTVVLVLIAGCVDFLISHDVRRVFEALANKTMLLAAAGLVVIMIEAVYFWRYDIKPERVFNEIERDGKAAALFLGLLSLGLLIAAGAIFGSL